MARTEEPPTPKGQATRAHLVDVASRVFAERGYAATRFSELIAESGLTKGAFYFYFPSKAALAAEVVREQDRRWVARVRERVLTRATPREQLADLIPAMIELLAQDPGAWSVVRLVRELAEDPPTDAPVEKPMDGWLTLLTGIIVDGQRAGDFRDDIDAAVLATVLVGAFDGIKALVDAAAADDPGGGDRIARLRAPAEALARLTLDGLEPR